MRYRKIYVSASDYVVEEIDPSGAARQISETQPDFLLWLEAGGVPEGVPYVAPPPPSIEFLKARKRTELMAARDALIADGFEHGEKRFPLTPDVQGLMLQEFVAAREMPGPYYAWKDTEGIYRGIGDAAAFIAFCLEAMAYGKALFAREAMLQEVLNALDSPEAVETVTWEMDVAPYMALLMGG